MPTFDQRLAFGQFGGGQTVVGGTVTPVLKVTYPYMSLQPLNYAEVQLTPPANTTPAASTLSVVNGNLTVSKYASVYMYLQGANNTTQDRNGVTADYIKLSPVLQ